MKRNQLLNKYSETVMRPPAMVGIEEKIPAPSKVPTIIERDFEDPIYDQLAELSKKKMEEGKPHRQKKMREQEIENLKRLLMDHEEEMGQDKPTFISNPDEELLNLTDPEISRPTSLTSGIRYSPDKILKMCSKFYDLCCKFQTHYS